MIEGQKIEAVRNVEAEAALIGAMLIDNRWIDRVADKLAPEDFFEALFGRIFTALVKEAATGRTVTAVTLKPYFHDDPAMIELGGIGYLATLTGDAGILLTAAGAIEQVATMAKRRRLIDGLTNAAMLASTLEASNEEVVSAADAALASMGDHDDGVVQISAGKAFDEMLAAYDEPTSGVTCGRISCIDEQLGPIRKHHLVIAGGRPGMGKTAFALSYSIGAAANGHGVLFVSLEMARGELMQRATADVCFDGQWGIPYDVIRDGRFRGHEDRAQVREAAQFFKQMPLHIVDAGSLTIGRLNMIVRRYKRRMEAMGQKLELVVVDYLQLLRPDHRCSQYEAVSEVSRGLKAIAKTYDVGVMALAQLSREVEKRDDKRPMLSDLRDSGQIEQDADAVVFLFRKEYYLRKALPDEADPNYATLAAALEVVQGQIDLIVAKRRNGVEGTAHARFHGRFQCVRDAA